MTDNVELRHMRALVAIGDELHLGRAARRLHITQQALGARLRELEEELGVRLLHRIVGTVELSEAGRELLGHARMILASVDSACRQTRRAGRAQPGELRLAYTPSLAPETLPHVAAAFRAGSPGIRLSTCEMWQQEATRGVAEGLYDAGMARHPALPEGLDCRVVRAEPLGVLLGGGHRLAALDRVPVRALADSVLAIWPRDMSPGFYDAVAALFPTNLAAGRVREMENFGSDVHARMEIASGRAFQPAFETQHDWLPPGWVWRPLSPSATIGVHLFFRAGMRSPALCALISAALTTAAARGWLATEEPSAGYAAGAN
ncbi:hypothetical protein GCM10023321_31270 [Pseudonocardia eucalypti]|uniref:HTH lysR-type domain-containing protein n=1 Tax=Pseudonocardia eucalypti TaxID=648755 RepID=A0ABP9Q320_9PSEU|nr:DNA-binding transcriptional LysR family regulator [Pseudonocardia eucalypti]